MQHWEPGAVPMVGSEELLMGGLNGRETAAFGAELGPLDVKDWPADHESSAIQVDDNGLDDW